MLPRSLSLLGFSITDKAVGRVSAPDGLDHAGGHWPPVFLPQTMPQPQDTLPVCSEPVLPETMTTLTM